MGGGWGGEVGGETEREMGRDWEDGGHMGRRDGNTHTHAHTQ